MQAIWVDSATSSKGISAHHTLYMASYTRTCAECPGLRDPTKKGRKISDTQLLDMLPRDVQAMLSVDRSAASGLPSDFLHISMSLLSDGVTGSALERAANCLVRERNEERAAGLYQRLLNGAQHVGQETFMHTPIDNATAGVNVTYISVRAVQG